MIMLQENDSFFVLYTGGSLPRHVNTLSTHSLNTSPHELEDFLSTLPRPGLLLPPYPPTHQIPSPSLTPRKTPINMDNNALEEDNTIYDNYRVTPDIIIQQPITSQPSSKPEGPISASDFKDGNDVNNSKDGNDVSCNGGADWRRRRDENWADRACSVDGEQTKREWSSDLFYSVTGKPHHRPFMDNAKQAVRDCCCLPPMLCSVARRLGEPPFLPFLPGTSTALRFKVRILGSISGSIGHDCLVTSCCWSCAVCQMYRELDDIGL
ncbi:hypothetical protein ACOMHN_059587 [Nucella lapillus]